jgi:hypothetical protein
MEPTKKILILFCYVLFYSFISAQNENNENSINTDILKVPASPASNLLNIASSEINKPTDVSNLMINLKNLPLNFINNGGFAIDIAPYWLFPSKGKNKSINNMLNMKDPIKYSIPQTLVYSFAVRNTDDSQQDQIPVNSIFTAVGFKFSIKRGNPDSTTLSKFERITKLLNQRSKTDREINAIVENSTKYKEFTSDNAKLLEALTQKKYPNKNFDQLSAPEKYEILSEPQYKLWENGFRLWKEQEINHLTYEDSEVLKANAEEIKSVNFKINRIGFLWDFAGGTSVQFKEKKFNSSKIYNAGLWTVLGYSFEKSGTPLFLLRYMYNPKSDWMTVEDFKPDGNFSTFDAGVKYEYSPKDSNFTGSLEGLYRSFISGSDLKPTWKCVLNLDYAIFANQHLTLSLGKDFDNNIIKKGNVIAGISFLSGIGTKRKIQ